MADLTYDLPSANDYDDVLAMASDWAVVRQLGGWKWPVDPEQVRHFCKPLEGDGFVWTIKDRGVFAGRIGITKGSIGYTLPRHVHGKGIATAASRYAIAQAFDLLNLDVITGVTWADNPASDRVLRKLGFDHWYTGYEYSKARRSPTLSRQYRLTRPAWDRLNASAS